MSSFSLPATCKEELGLDPCLFCVSKQVAHAVRSGYPVVALESTIITHGLPFPKNYETAIAAESRIRDRGALPATVAIVQGVVHVGASEEVGPWRIWSLSIFFFISAEVIMRLAKLGKAVDKARSRSTAATRKCNTRCRLPGGTSAPSLQTSAMAAQL